jgi:hypothetical protein
MHNHGRREPCPPSRTKGRGPHAGAAAGERAEGGEGAVGEAREVVAGYGVGGVVKLCSSRNVFHSMMQRSASS